MTSPRRPVQLFLSAHLDDAVLSCGGTMRWLARRDFRVVVVTIFAGVPTGWPTPAARAARKALGRSAGDVARRRAEDRAACSTLGVEAVHLPFLDSVHRRRYGRPLYRTRAAIFGEPAAADQALVAVAAQALRGLDVWTRAETIHAPLAIGQHVDHQLARRAAEAAARAQRNPVPPRPIRYYEDVPYVLYDAEALWRPDLACRLVPLVRPLDEDCSNSRITAINCYVSQLPSIWPNDPDWPIELRRHARATAASDYGERLWSPTE